MLRLREGAQSIKFGRAGGYSLTLWTHRPKKMTTRRTHFTFRVNTWTPDGESIVEHIAGVEDYQVALATKIRGHQLHFSVPMALYLQSPGLRHSFSPRIGFAHKVPLRESFLCKI